MRGRWTVGPGGLVYVMLTGVLGAGAWYTQANLLFWAVGLMTGGLVASMGWIALTLRGLSVERAVPGQAVAGEALVLRYQLRNRSRLPVFSLTLTEVWNKRRSPVIPRPRRLKGPPMGWVLHLGPRSAGVAESACWPLRRGPLRFERVRLGTSFPFGVIGKWVEFEGDGSVLVYPPIYPLSKRLAYRAWSATSGLEDASQRSGREGEVIGMRAYREGDPRRSIDWKRTARSGQLVSREYGRPLPPLAMIELDLPPPPPDADPILSPLALAGARRATRKRAKRARASDADAAASRADWLTRAESAIALSASLIHDAYLRGYRVGLTVQGAAAAVPVFEPKHAASHLAHLLDVLAKVRVPGDTEEHDADGSGTAAVKTPGGLFASRRGSMPGTVRVTAGHPGGHAGADRANAIPAEPEAGSGHPLRKGAGNHPQRGRGRLVARGPVLGPEDLDWISGGRALSLAELRPSAKASNDEDSASTPTSRKTDDRRSKTGGRG